MARWTVLGSGTALATASRGASGHLLEVDGARILFDAGAGTLGRLAAVDVSADAIDRVFLTHYHLDHVNEIPALLFALGSAAFDRPRTVAIHGPRGLLDLRDGWRAAHGEWIEPRQTRIEWLPFEAGWEQAFAFGRLATFATGHTEHSVAYRIALPDGFVVVYSGDTGYTPEFAAFAAGADMLVLECALERATATDRHLDADGAGRIAAEANVGRLVLTHFYPDVDVAAVPARVAQHYAGEAWIAHDGMRIELDAD